MLTKPSSIGKDEKTFLLEFESPLLTHFKFCCWLVSTPFEPASNFEEELQQQTMSGVGTTSHEIPCICA